MSHDDDLERLISGSLTSRAERVGTAAHSLDDVHRRVELRRGRRRHVAVFGATTMVAAGAFALTAIGSSDPSVTPLVPADAADQPDVQTAWRCTGQLDVTDDHDSSYFAYCEQVTVDDSVSATVPLYPTTTTVCAVPTTPPPSEPVVTGVPCDWAPPATVAPDDCATMSRPADVTVPDNCDTMSTTTTVDERFPGEQEYTVQAGDSLASIADRYGITLEQLINYNEFDDGADHVLLPGDRLLVPPGALVPSHTVPVTTSTSIP